MQRLAVAFSAQPIASSFFLAAMAVLTAMAVVATVRGKGTHAFWCVVALILLSVSVGFGEDIDHHVYRVVALANQVRAGVPGLLLINPFNGEALPTFVYYSFVPYLPAVLLDLCGLPAHAAFKVVLALELIILALGLRRLVDRLSASAEALNAGCLVAILLLCANYVYGVWLQRMAFAETWVYCFIPWVVVMLMTPGARLPLIALLFLQIAGHPIVFAQAFVCSLLLAWGLSSEPLPAILRRCVVAAASALVLAAPFWLPQFLSRDLILGPAGLPVKFSESFLSLQEVFDRRALHAIGPVLPLAIGLLVVVSRARLPFRAWALIAAFVASLALQTTFLRPLTEHLPLLPSSLFVWRLMLPAAMLGFGALLAGWRPHVVHDRWLAATSLLSVAGMLIVLIGAAPAALSLVARQAGDAYWHDTYLKTNLVWGRHEFLPNYASVGQRCGATVAGAQPTSFADLQKGVTATSTFLVVPSAPLGFVSYSANGAGIVPGACAENAVFGPLQPGTVVTASSPQLEALLWVRIASLLVCVTGVLLIALRSRRPAIRQGGTS